MHEAHTTETEKASGGEKEGGDSSTLSITLERDEVEHSAKDEEV